MKTFHLTIAKVGENLFDADAVSVTLPGKDGVFQALAGHEALVSELQPGKIHVKTVEDEVLEFAVLDKGVAEISHNQATVLL